MRNFDRLTEDEIIDALAGGGIAVRKEDNKVHSCDHLNCNECRFCTGEGDCARYQRHWLLTESVLPDSERKYLSAVIRPFVNQVEHITKVYNSERSEYYIRVCVKNDIRDDTFSLPAFSAYSDMYKDMEADYQYTLEELGLNVKVEE